MTFTIDRLNPISLDLYKKNSNKRSFADSQNKSFDILEDFDPVSLDNKEKNRQEIEKAAKLISIIQSDESGDFKKACEKYLTKVSTNTQDHHNKGVLELVNVIRDHVSVTVANASQNFRNRVSDLFNEDFAAGIGSAISDLGRYCCDLCEAISTIGNNGLKYSEVSC